MQLILDDYGVLLEKKEDMFLIRKGEQARTISPLKVHAIHVFKNAMLSTAALLLASENDVQVLVYDGHFKPAIRVWNSNFSSTGKVRIMQPAFCNSSDGMWWAKKLIRLKMEGQLSNLATFRNRYMAARGQINETAAFMNNTLQQIDNLQNDTKNIEALMGHEGRASAYYWQALQEIIKASVFTKRVQRDPADPYNACANYLYGILYGKVEGALLAYGLDPFVGIIHAEGYSKKCLVYDCIEPFRQWAELLLIRLFKSNLLLSEHFEYGDERVSIAKEGRKILVKEFINFLTEKTLFNSKRISRNDQLIALCSQLAQAVKNFDINKI